MLHNAEQRRGTGTSAVQSHDLSPSISLIRKASIIMLALICFGFGSVVDQYQRLDSNRTRHSRQTSTVGCLCRVRQDQFENGPFLAASIRVRQFIHESPASGPQ